MSPFISASFHSFVDHSEGFQTHKFPTLSIYHTGLTGLPLFTSQILSTSLTLFKESAVSWPLSLPALQNYQKRSVIWSDLHLVSQKTPHPKVSQCELKESMCTRSSRQSKSVLFASSPSEYIASKLPPTIIITSQRQHPSPFPHDCPPPQHPILLSFLRLGPAFRN